MKYAIVKNGTVENMVEWDGVSEFSVDGELVPVPSHAEGLANIGGQHDGTDNYNAFSYTPPEPPPVPQSIIDREAKKDSARSKLEGLGLTIDEIQAAFGI